MPLRPNFLERAMFYGFKLGPAPVLDIWSAVGFRVVVAALRLGVFDALSEEPMRVDELAGRIGASPDGVQVLLRALEAVSYVEARGDKYANSAMTAKWLTSASAANLAPFLRYWGAILDEQWGSLEQSIRDGKGAVKLYGWLEDQPDVSRDFQEGLVALAHIAAPELVGALDVPTEAKRALDVGGGHAGYAIALCEKHPGLSVTVLDSPQALVVARERIAAAGLEGRITTQAGDFLSDDLGTGYGIALLLNIVHGLKPEQNVALLKRVATALAPGGRVAIVDQLADSAPLPMARAAGQLLGLSYLHLLNGQAYTREEMTEMCVAAGLGKVRHKALVRSASSLIMADKPTT